MESMREQSKLVPSPEELARRFYSRAVGMSPCRVQESLDVGNGSRSTLRH